MDLSTRPLEATSRTQEHAGEENEKPHRGALRRGEKKVSVPPQDFATGPESEPNDHQLDDIA